MIVATGKRPRPLNVSGEDTFKNKGLTYCATCDGPLFKDKPVAVIGGGNSALDATLQMMRLCPQVYMINIAPQLQGDTVMIDTVQAASNVKIWHKTQVKKIYGDIFVQGIEVEKENKLYRLAVEGIFVEIGLIPETGFAGALGRNGAGEIMVDCYNQTNQAGVFAAGDVTNVPEKQIIIACGEGSKASLAAFRYLSTHQFNTQEES